MQVTPHVAQHSTHHASAIDGRITCHAGYTVSLQRRKRVEEVFGWLKTIGYVTQSEPLWRAAGQLAVHFRYGRLEPGADA